MANFAMHRPRMSLVRFLLVLAFSTFASGASAQDAAKTEPEQLYEKLAASEQSADKRLGERWQQLVRQRQWVDASGKHKVFAKYISHDSGLKSVKLLVLSKSGDTQSYKEVTVPLARLGKTEQTLVKQIDRLRKPVEEAAAGVKSDAAATGEGASGLEGEGRVGRPTRLDGQQPDTRRAPEGAESPPVMEQSPENAPVGREGRPLPPGAVPPGAIPSGAAPPGEALRGAPPMMQPPQQRDHNTPIAPDAAAWRTDFSAFAGNPSATRGGEGGKWDVQFGELNDLKAAWEAAYQMGHALGQQAPGSAKFGQIFMASQAYAMASMRLGEVTWETTLAAPIEPGPGGIKHDLSLPEPFKITLAVDDGDVGDYSRFKQGDRVRFIGRFYDLGGAGETPTFTLHVRFPDEQVGVSEAGSGEVVAPARPVLRPREK
jgi:hypothetical protein